MAPFLGLRIRLPDGAGVVVATVTANAVSGATWAPGVKPCAAAVETAPEDAAGREAAVAFGLAGGGIYPYL